MEIAIFLFVVVGVCFLGLVVFSRAMSAAARATAGSKRPLIAKVVLGVGGAALIGAVGFALHAWHFSHVAERAEGTVVEMRERRDKESERISYAPTFRFLDGKGVEHTVNSGLFSYPPEFQTGDRVAVLYLAEEPQAARIDSRWQLWGIPRLLGILGSIYLLVGLVILFWPRIIGCFKG